MSINVGIIITIRIKIKRKEKQYCNNIIFQYIGIFINEPNQGANEPSISPLGRASPFWRDPTPQLNSLSKFVFVYMTRGPALLDGISLLTTEISPRRGGNFPYKRSFKAPCTRQMLSWPAYFQITFHFTSSVCLCVGYKIKTSTQISDFGFRGKINVVVDPAKRASPGRRASFSHVNTR